MSIDIKAMGLTPKRQTFAHIARRMGQDKPASRYEESMYDLQATDHFHYRPLWAPEYELYDASRTAIVMADWYALRDPRQYYYGTYTQARANAYQGTERNIDFVQKSALLEQLSDEWRDTLVRVLIPLRHVEWGANMTMAKVTDEGYGTAITSASAFAMADRLGLAQFLTRVGMILSDEPEALLDKAKAHWMDDPEWQGVRRIVEDNWVTEDWFEAFVAQTVALDGLIYPLAYEAMDKAGQAQGGAGISMVCQFPRDWYAEHGRWVDAVLKVAAAESDANAATLSGWAKQWTQRVEEALQPLAEVALGAGGREALADIRGALNTRMGKLGIDTTGAGQ